MVTSQFSIRAHGHGELWHRIIGDSGFAERKDLPDLGGFLLHRV